MTSLMRGEHHWDASTCVETMEIMFSTPNRIEHMLDLASERPGAFKEIAAGYVPSHPKPDANDILSAEVSTRGAWTILTVRIRRGHYVVADFLRRHAEAVVVNGAEITVLECNDCGQVVVVPLKSIGRHRGVQAPGCFFPDSGG